MAADQGTIRDRFEGAVDSAVPVATGIGLIAAIAISAFSDAPDALPGIALGSEALFYLERALAVMAATAILLMLLVRGLKRQVPSEATTTGLGYPDPVKEAVDSSESAVGSLARRVDGLEQDRERQQQAIRLLVDTVKDLQTSVEAMKRQC